MELYDVVGLCKYTAADSIAATMCKSFASPFWHGTGDKSVIVLIQDSQPEVAGDNDGTQPSIMDTQQASETAAGLLDFAAPRIPAETSQLSPAAQQLAALLGQLPSQGDVPRQLSSVTKASASEAGQSLVELHEPKDEKMMDPDSCQRGTLV